jgi:serine/threonine protein kinase
MKQHIVSRFLLIFIMASVANCGGGYPNRITSVLSKYCNDRGASKNGYSVQVDKGTQKSLLDECHNQTFIGKGGFGKVYSATFREKTVAVKKMEITNLNIDEINFLVNHNKTSGIPEIYGCEKGTQTLYLVMELLYKDLDSPEGLALFSKKSFKERIDDYRDFLGTLKNLHAKDLLHRDIKPANMMIKNQVDSKIFMIDFGMIGPVTMRIVAGTPLFSSPRLSLGTEYTNKADDLFAAIISFAGIEFGQRIFNKSHEDCVQKGFKLDCHADFIKRVENVSSDKQSDRINDCGSEVATKFLETIKKGLAHSEGNRNSLEGTIQSLNSMSEECEKYKKDLDKKYQALAVEKAKAQGKAIPAAINNVAPRQQLPQQKELAQKGLEVEPKDKNPVLEYIPEKRAYKKVEARGNEIKVNENFDRANYKKQQNISQDNENADEIKFKLADKPKDENKGNAELPQRHHIDNDFARLDKRAPQMKEFHDKEPQILNRPLEKDNLGQFDLYRDVHALSKRNEYLNNYNRMTKEASSFSRKKDPNIKVRDDFDSKKKPDMIRGQKMGQSSPIRRIPEEVISDEELKRLKVENYYKLNFPDSFNRKENKRPMQPENVNNPKDLDRQKLMNQNAPRNNNPMKIEDRPPVPGDKNQVKPAIKIVVPKNIDERIEEINSIYEQKMKILRNNSAPKPMIAPIRYSLALMKDNLKEINRNNIYINKNSFKKDGNGSSEQNRSKVLFDENYANEHEQVIVDDHKKIFIYNDKESKREKNEEKAKEADPKLNPSISPHNHKHYFDKIEKVHPRLKSRDGDNSKPSTANTEKENICTNLQVPKEPANQSEEQEGTDKKNLNNPTDASDNTEFEKKQPVPKREEDNQKVQASAQPTYQNAKAGNANADGNRNRRDSPIAPNKLRLLVRKIKKRNKIFGGHRVIRVVDKNVNPHPAMPVEVVNLLV